LNVDGEPAMLFTVRSGNVGTHKHHVSFPGGHLEAGEGAIVAAVRECREEVGLSATAIGEHNDAIAVTGTLVTPVLGYVDGLFESGPPSGGGTRLLRGPGLQANAAEVDSVFALSLSHLLHPMHMTLEQHTPQSSEIGVIRRSVTMPVFDGGPQRIWGLTAVLLAGFLRDMILPAWEETGRPLHPGSRDALLAAAVAITKS